jgi:beta-glucosidase
LIDADSGSLILNQTALDYYIGQLGVGSVLNTVDGVAWTAREYRNIMMQIQECAANYSRPPVIWGLDSVHGANFVHGAILTPQPLNLAATFNRTVAWEAGKLASRDTRAAGINWLFSPVLGLALEPRWSRVYETFGEDPFLVGEMASQMIQGIQYYAETNATQRPIPSRAAACAKHFIGYSQPVHGHDRSPSWIPNRHLYQYFVPPWKKAIEAGKVLSVMESYTETDGVPNVANPETINYLLRQRLKFDGVVVTDFEEMRHLYHWHHVAMNETDAVSYALSEASVDMSMIPWNAKDFREGILHGLRNNILSPERLDESARRILKMKEDLNMFDETIRLDDPNLELVGTDAALVQEMVEQGIILAKNEAQTLPLSSDSLNILVTGPTANSRVYQSGGWTSQWQGAPDEFWFTYGSTVADAMMDETSWNVTYSCGVDILGTECETRSIENAVKVAKNSNVVVIGVGEEAYTEKPGDIRSSYLPKGQYELVDAIASQTSAKIVLIYFGGRPRLLGTMVEQADAVLLGFLPGPSAGSAIVSILKGQENPSARLPITYPISDDGAGSPYYHAVSDQCTAGEGKLPHFEFIPCAVQWNFGHGLSFTTFEYTNFTVSGDQMRGLEVAVYVKNTGAREGSETVLFFTFDVHRRTTPEYKRLRAFSKVHLQVGEVQYVQQKISTEDLRFVGPHDDKHFVLDPTMKFWVGVGASTDCRNDDAINNELCFLVENDPPQLYDSSCESACDLWIHSGCSSHFGLSKSSCLQMCTAINEVSSNARKDGWGWGYTQCLEAIITGMEAQDQLHNPAHCWKMTSMCRDIFRTGQLDSHGIGPDSHGRTEQVPLSFFAALLSAFISSYYFFSQLKTRRSNRQPEYNETAITTPYTLLRDQPETEGGEQEMFT